ncbi:MAG: glycoside hydrolase family 16 protein, partial [Actinomycetota bacterium]|nr:glycoside hydrolase family 16 protein [Actinomycetota bacterium]
VAQGTSTSSPPTKQPAVAGAGPRHSAGLVWHDEFTGRAGAPPNRAHWGALSGPRNDQLQNFRPDNVSLDGAGHLVITARRQVYTDRNGVTRQFTSGSIETRGLFQTPRYGSLLARIEIPRGKGLWPAFWALGNNYGRVGWPRCGEIDVMENTGGNPFRIKGSIHGPQAHTSIDYAVHRVAWSRVSLATGFHIYGVTWRPGKIIFTLDGVHYGTVTPADLSNGQRWVFDKPVFLILTLAIQGGPSAQPDAATRFPARMLVDWVRVYR